MGGEQVIDSWFSNLWRTSRKSMTLEPDKAVIGILAFEVASLMSKVVNLWHYLSDKQIVRLREEIVNSLGIQKLVSDNDYYLMDLALIEIVEKLECVAKSVVRLGKRCVDPVYQNLERIFDDSVEIVLNCCAWEYRPKKMERKVKKMERFVAATAQLYQEVEVLAELEQSLRRMQVTTDLSRVKLLEFQQKVMWQRQEVRHLREMSPWIRTYDYTVRLLLRSLFTIVKRIKHIFGVNQIGAVEGTNDPHHSNTDGLVRSHSISALMQAAVHPSGSNLSKFYSAPLERSASNLELSSGRNKSNNKKAHAFILSGKHPRMKTRRLAQAGPFGGCMMAGRTSPVLQSCMPSSSGSLMSTCVFLPDGASIKNTNRMQYSYGDTIYREVSLFHSKRKLLAAPPSTLGDAALALHYANVIILIEKLASSPHLISLDDRNELYNMLPTSVRKSLRAKLKVFIKTLASSVYDEALAVEWGLALIRILEWLAPLAHNMIRWHSERNFEKQHIVSGTNVLLVQTLYFASQAKTEAAIAELLMGLNYLSRFGSEFNKKAFLGSGCSRTCLNYLLYEDNIVHGVIDQTT
ncbi:unnamed protein product [Ilex paraguariensis]|uniref:DUF668 domain-containing protein n=1 Tax=Ilex paraguariensis TaxID=185542 RepID=A0ABC8R127_9AQUA